MGAEHSLSWPEWASLNVSRGCPAHELLDILTANGFAHDEACRMLGLSPGPIEQPYLPTAMRLDAPDIEIHGIDGFLSEEECVRLIGLMRDRLRRSTTTEEGVSDFRTSRTCELAALDDPFVQAIDERICRYMGIDPTGSEAIEAQWYEQGQEFKAHTDCFDPHSPGYEDQIETLGQRTWTFMIYLNTTRRGGATHFPECGLTVQPRAGTALVWNNRLDCGTPNPATLHHGTPVEAGYKAVITKWFRSRDAGFGYRKTVAEHLTPLTRDGFLKLPVPEALHRRLLQAYRQRRDERTDERTPDPDHAGASQVPTRLTELDGALRAHVHEALQPIVEAWVGDHLQPSVVHGIRECGRGSTIGLHRDPIRTHAVGVLLDIDQQARAHWPLHIEDDDCRAHEVVLAPGEMLLHEGARLSHGRPTPCPGDGYADLLAHFRLGASS